MDGGQLGLHLISLPGWLFLPHTTLVQKADIFEQDARGMLCRSPLLLRYSGDFIF